MCLAIRALFICHWPLKPFIRGLMVQMDRDLDTKVDWVASIISTTEILMRSFVFAAATIRGGTSS
jgi:hypothetical protein